MSRYHKERTYFKQIYNELSSKHGFDCPVPLKIQIKALPNRGNGVFSYGTICNQLTEAAIIINRLALDMFGVEEMTKTFRHEVAHLANFVLYGGEDHDERFKQLCKEFGGHMNPTVAGEEYKECVGTSYYSPSLKFEYVCPKCGKSYPTSRKIVGDERKEMCFYTCAQCDTPFFKWHMKRLTKN